MKPVNPVGWFEIYVDDLARARAFYEDMLEVELHPLDAETMPEFLAFPAGEGYGAGGALAKVDGMAPGNNSVMVYFECDDCGETAKRAASAGGEIVQDRFSIGQFGFCAMIRDSEGNLIGLHSEA
jgi:predicted enzyme related to lactoylglutathione lyase